MKNDRTSTTDATRSVKSVTYHRWGCLPRQVTFDNGDFISSTYRSDGALVSRKLYEPKVHVALASPLSLEPAGPVSPFPGGMEPANRLVGGSDHFGGWRNVKLLNSGEMRRVRDCCIFRINDMEVFL